MTDQPTARSDRIVTVPNAISVLRLCLVPVFVYLVVRHQDIWAIAVLALAGVTDWLDGLAARRLNQYTKLGRLLDPAADRLFILSTVFLLGWRGIVPWWLVALLAAREAVMGLALAAAKLKGIDPPAVVFVGKTATFALMYAFPLLLLAEVSNRTVANAAWVLGWACAIWGLVLYWVACGAYLIEVYRALRRLGRAGGAGGGRGGAGGGPRGASGRGGDGDGGAGGGGNGCGGSGGGGSDGGDGDGGSGGHGAA